MKVGIVSHDAGGAENISHWAKLQKYQFLFCIEGPAQLVFKRNLGNYKNTDIQDVVRKSDWIICGSSWQSNLEKIAVREAKLHKKKTVVFLDHWVNYELRFIRNRKLVLPDFIWVFDEFAEKKAKKLFKNIEVQKLENYYIKDLVEDIQKLETTSTSIKTKILYVLEPFRKSSSIENYLYEYEVLDFFKQEIITFSMK